MMKVTSIKILLVLSVLFNVSYEILAQDLSNSDYKKALWMTTRFYGGQRSGENNWLLFNHLPNGVNSNLRGLAFRADRDGSRDLSGGWHDCGDHVKFGQTQFFSAYVLLKGYEQFKKGYDDYYSADYAGYKSQSTTGNATGWKWEGNAHDPNGIPDILDEVKHATDFFIKCTPNTTTFYYQIGDGGASGDHATNNTAVTIQTLAVNKGGNNDNGAANPSGPFRGAYKNPNDGAMASMCAATLALMSKQYEPFDPAYAALCLTHAKNAYAYASSHVGQTAGTANGGFYGAHDNAYNPWAICLGEMFKATKENSYKTTMNALSVGLTGSPQVRPNVNYSFDYSNVGELALYVMAELGNTSAKTAFNQHYTNHWVNSNQYSGEGNYKGGGGWGQLRYTGNASFIVALYSKLNNLSTLNQKVYDNVDYILGSNNAKQSFIVGYSPSSLSGVDYAKHPHHRNLYLRDDTPSGADMVNTPIPSKNLQFGALVGGNKTNSAGYDDTWTEYVNTEVCIDYNAGIVGGLGAVNAFLNPIDTNKFLTQCASPGDLGGNQTLCGVGSIILNSELTTKTGRTFQWFKDDVSQGAPSSSATTKSITQAGTWKVVVDSAGACQRSASVVITGELPLVSLGDDIELCTPAQVTLDAGVSGAGISYAWKKGSQSFGGNTKTIEVTEAGTYQVTLSATGCNNQTGSVVVTSSLPVVDAQVICSAGATSLEVTSSGGPFEWYTVETGGTPVFTGDLFTPSITSTKTYYVKDAGSFEQTIGPKQGNHSLTTPTNGGAIGILFTSETGFEIIEMKIQPYVYNCNPGDMVQLSMELQTSDGTKISTHVAKPVACTGSQQGPFTTYYTMDFSEDPIKVLSAGNYILKPSAGNQLAWYESGANYNNYQIEGVMSITGDTRNDKSNSFPGIFDIKLSSGNDCDRMPVVAKIDGNDPNCIGGCTKPANATINPAGTQNLCGNETITLTANTVPDYLYRWYRNGTPITTAALNNRTLVVSQTGDYSVRIGDGDTDDNTCYLESSSTKVNINAAPTALITTTTLEYCSSSSNGVTLTAMNQGTGATYEWSGPVTGGSVALQNATAGSYVVKVTKDNCIATSAAVEVVNDCVTSSINDEFGSQFKLYPNPSVSTFTLELNENTNSFIRVVNMNGVLISEYEIQNRGELEFGSDLQQGVYLLQIIQGDKMYSRQVTKFD